jgi:acetyl-CoA carboxylase biotin carboxyl carrier protein
MEINDLEKIINILKENGVTEFELNQEGTHIRLSRATSMALPEVAQYQLQNLEPAIRGSATVQLPASSVPAQDPTEGFLKVESPIVGTFYSKPSPDSAPFAEPGKKVKKGETLCIVEAMKLMNEIESPAAGVIEKVLLKDGQVVEFGEILFLLRPE